jgi:hypothetical protein
VAVFSLSELKNSHRKRLPCRRRRKSILLEAAA